MLDCEQLQTRDNDRLSLPYSKSLASSIVFIDTRVEEVSTLIQGILPDAEVVLIPQDKDGVDVITNALQFRGQVRSIHIISHGEPGCLFLGCSELSLQTFDRYASQLRQWSLAARHHESPELNLYGCNLANGDAGAEFLEKLYRYTKLTVAASRQKVGFGEWHLEVAVGTSSPIRQVPLSDASRNAYHRNLGLATLVRDINPDGPSFPYPAGYSSGPAVVGDLLFFTARDGETGRELWVSDGTESGTQLVRDIGPNGDVYSYYSYYIPFQPYDLTPAGDQLFFTARDGETGRELWVSDGTEIGTRLIDINPDGSSFPSQFVAFGNQVFFVADDGESGRELWISDGTETGTRLVRDIVGIDDDLSFRESFIFGDRLFFSADDGETGGELWVTDGTEVGTQLIDINPNGSSFPTGFTGLGEQLFFSADDGETGRELWVTDGTEVGTQLIDINPNGSSSPTGLTVFGDRLFFSADDGEIGRELWVTDGTESGTQLVSDINADGGAGANPYDLTVLADQLFFSADDGETGEELWVSDGTKLGTRLVKDVNQSNRLTFPPSSLTVVGDLLFFLADDGVFGTELWVSDGTEAGTRLVRDINSRNGEDSLYATSPGDFMVAGDLLFFTAGNTSFRSRERELWVSDGTTSGTFVVSDTGPDNTAINGPLGIAGDHIFFAARESRFDNELWSLTIPENVAGGNDEDNSILATGSVDLIKGFAGNDTIRARNGDDLVDGGEGSDSIFGDGGNDSIEGGLGDDQIFGNAGDDTLVGGRGNNILNGGKGSDTASYTALDTLIRVNLNNGSAQFVPPGQQPFADQLLNIENLEGSRFDDRLIGNSQANKLSGQAGNDILSGLGGNDILLGGAGRDRLKGGLGRDELIGGDDSDTLFGRAGDTLDGGRGSDRMLSGRSRVTFRFRSDLLDDIEDLDVIVGYDAVDDFDFDDYLGAGGTITFDRLSSTFLRINLSDQDRVNIFGTALDLDGAETTLNRIL